MLRKSLRLPGLRFALPKRDFVNPDLSVPPAPVRNGNHELLRLPSGCAGKSRAARRIPLKRLRIQLPEKLPFDRRLKPLRSLPVLWKL